MIFILSIKKNSTFRHDYSCKPWKNKQYPGRQEDCLDVISVVNVIIFY